MRGYLTLVRRELASYFLSLTGYVVMAAVLLLTGASFVVMIEALNNDSINIPLTELFFGTPFFWVVLLVSWPVTTMRLFALEKATGTYETLMTAPVSDLAIVLAKFTAALFFHLIVWAPSLAVLQVVHRYSAQGAPFEWWSTASTFLGILMVGALYMAMGCLASALTRSQIIAAMTSFALGVSVFLLSFLKFSVSSRSGLWAGVITYLSLFDQMEDLVRGVIDTRHLVLHASITAWFLFLTLKVVESRRWK